MQGFRHMRVYINRNSTKVAIMKQNFLLVIGAAMMLTIGLNSCSSNDDETFYTKKGSEVTRVSSGDTNALTIHSETGDEESCEVDKAYCGRISWPAINCDRSDSTYNVYPMVFTAVIKNSSLFNVLQFDFSSNSVKIEDLQVGDTIATSAIRMKAWQDSSNDNFIRWQNSPYALAGQILVVGKKISEEEKSYITLYLQDLTLDGWSSTCLESNYIFNGKIEFEISDNGIYPDDGFDPESLLIPHNDFSFFMMDALHREDGRRAFFTEHDGAGQQECLIINSEEEFRKAYKGDMELQETKINFEYCTLVIGRTYGENGGVSLGGFELKDNGDSYQLDVTLNQNVNPDFLYAQAFTDLYFWKLYPKMENKPVVFNRIKQDVNLDPAASANAHVCQKWTLVSYSDADGTFHQLNNGRGDERYSIQFKENGMLEGSVDGANIFSCYYSIPYSAKRAYYEDLDHGIINLTGWEGAPVNADDPISQKMMRINSVTQFMLLANPDLVVNLLTLYISPEEFLMFQHEVEITN